MNDCIDLAEDRRIRLFSIQHFSYCENRVSCLIVKFPIIIIYSLLMLEKSLDVCYNNGVCSEITGSTNKNTKFSDNAIWVSHFPEFAVSWITAHKLTCFWVDKMRHQQKTVNVACHYYHKGGKPHGRRKIWAFVNPFFVKS